MVRPGKKGTHKPPRVKGSFTGPWKPQGPVSEPKSASCNRVVGLVAYSCNPIIWKPQLKDTCTDFHQIFRGCLPQGDLELIRFLGVSGNNCCHGNTFKIFSLKICVPQPKPLHGFSPNFQGMFTPIESRAD